MDTTDRPTKKFSIVRLEERIAPSGCCCVAPTGGSHHGGHHGGRHDHSHPGHGGDHSPGHQNHHDHPGHGNGRHGH